MMSGYCALFAGFGNKHGLGNTIQDIWHPSSVFSVCRAFVLRINTRNV